MKYKITTKYCWYNNASMIVKMYLIQDTPFTFDELSLLESSDPEIIALADKERDYDPEDLYLSSFYLIDEQAHPLVYDMNSELENPEDLPQDEEPE
jgi:hypothetical protein